MEEGIESACCPKKEENQNNTEVALPKVGVAIMKCLVEGAI